MKTKFLIFCFLTIILSFNVVRSQDKYNLPPCKPSNLKSYFGERFIVQIPKKAILKNQHDVDYFQYFIGFGKKKNRVWLSGIHGPNASEGRIPKDYLEESSEFFQRTWVYDDLQGADVKGKLKNGNYWRYFGAFGEEIHYYNVPLEAANYFDSILDGICYKK